MQFITIFIFTLSTGTRYRIVSRSFKQALSALGRFSGRYDIIHVELRIRISLHEKHF